jgi:NAD(P)-dependent dehydrogenase (short-subunit alcohol dehydrogenase family)
MMSTSIRLFSLEGKTAIVTGALGLLGREHCRALAGAGASVIVADLDGTLCEKFARELERESQQDCLAAPLDVTNPDTLRQARDRVVGKFGRIDVLVNNAALNDMVEHASQSASGAFETFPLDVWRRCLEVNLTGPFLCSQVFGNVMAEQGRGSIINIASTYGVVAPDQSLYRKPDGTQTFTKSPVYPATKGAILSLTRYLAAYWGHRGVRVNALSPGGVQNGQEEYFVQNYAARTPLGRMAGATDYRGAVVFLASDASAYMTGANLIVDGGWTAW